MNSNEVHRLMDRKDIEHSVNRLAFEIAESFPGDEISEVALIGLQSRGVTLAHRLILKLNEITGSLPLFGKLDISMYRDDIGMRKTLPKILETRIPFDVTDRHTVLVDDVLWTGRTIRAALDAITDYGRPKTIRLAVLIDRKGREFPIQAEYAGMNYSVPDFQRVTVNLEENDGDEAVYVTPQKKQESL